MSQRLRTRLMLVYGLAALLVFGLSAFAIHLAVMDKFASFAEQNRERRRGDFVRVLSSMISENGNVSRRGARMAMRRFGIRSVVVRATDNRVLLELRMEEDGPAGRMHQRVWTPGQAARADACQVWSEDLVIDGRIAGRMEVVALGDPPHFALIENVFMEEVLRVLVLATGVAILVFGGLSWSFARTIARPLESASEAAGRIAGGDLDARVIPSGVREVAALADDFNGMADALSRKEGLRTRMTSDIAHELRTPVSVLKSHLEGIRDGILPADEDEVASLIDETVRLERIINDLRAIWELENAGTLLKMEPFCVGPAMEALAERFGSVARARGMRITVSGDPGCRVLADVGAFERAFSNIIANAIKYGRDGGLTAISWEPGQGVVRILVRDDGPGIPEDDLPHIFERFYRADEARARKDGGAGLGLAIATEAVTACRGSIRVENNPDTGCTFVVQLPCAGQV